MLTYMSHTVTHLQYTIYMSLDKTGIIKKTYNNNNNKTVSQWGNSQCESLQTTQAATRGAIEYMGPPGLHPRTFCVEGRQNAAFFPIMSLFS